MIYALLVFSILLEGSLSNIININFLEPCFLLPSILIMYNFLKKNKIKYIIICLLCGLIYDIIFTNMQFINTISFTACGLLIIFLYNYINYNMGTYILFNIFIIIFYRVIQYIFLCILHYFDFNMAILIESIYNTLILNMVYGFIIFILFRKKKI